ncbi:MAG: M20/M25/M40 family metallo-hydrolase, partial [Thiotrichaceae bacterium]|nr:M20/M25/M40 family metallo-hydrolase [Thiotrichaceae bacterium]
TLEAVEILLKQGFIPKKTIYLAFGHDEELGGLFGAKAIADHLKAKGIKPAMILDEGGFVLRKLVPGVTKPVGMIGIAEKGYVNLTLSVKGTEGHSSMPPKQTAIGILSSAIAKLESNPSPARYEGATKLLFDSVSPHMPFKQRMVFANMWLFKPVVIGILEKGNATNATLRSTFAVTIVDGGLKDNILPASATANVNVRLLPGDSSDSIVKYAQTVIDDERVTVKGSLIPNEASSVSSTTSAEYKALETVISQVFKKDNVVVAPFLTINGTDSKHYSEITDNTYRFLPISLDSEGIKLIHGVNENISIDNYIRMIQFYVALIENLGTKSP